MIPVTASTPVLIAIAPVDFRRQMDGLIAHCRQALSADPMTGTLFVFIKAMSELAVVMSCQQLQTRKLRVLTAADNAPAFASILNNSLST